MIKKLDIMMAENSVRV